MSQDFKAISDLLAKITNRVPIMRIIAGTMHAAVMKNFEAEGRPGKWQQLAKSTIKDRSKKGYWPGRILQRSGALKRSILQYSTNDFAAVGTNNKYAAIQNFGGTINRKAFSGKVSLRTDKKGNLIRKKKNSNLAVFAKKSHKLTTERTFESAGYGINIPARPFMFLPDEAIKDIENDIINYLTKS